MRNQLVRVFLKCIVAFFIWFFVTALGAAIMSATDRRSIPAVFLFGSFYVAYLLCFSKWADKNIWMRYNHKPNNIIQIDAIKRNEAISYLKQGNNEYRNGRFVQAIKYYSKAIDTDSNFKEAYGNRAKARKALGDNKGYNEDRNMFSTLKSKTNKNSKRISSNQGWGLSQYLTIEVLTIVFILQSFSYIIFLNFPADFTFSNIFKIVQFQVISNVVCSLSLGFIVLITYFWKWEDNITFKEVLYIIGLFSIIISWIFVFSFLGYGHNYLYDTLLNIIDTSRI